MTDDTSTQEAVDQQLDKLSLTQALRDFDVANARARDLTERLMTATRELAEARRELDQVRNEHDTLQDTHDRMRSSAAFRLANRIWEIRQALRI